MAFSCRSASPGRKGQQPAQILSEELVVQFFLAELDAAGKDENPHVGVCAVLLRALFHPRVYVFAELLGHAAVAALSVRRDLHCAEDAVGRVLSLTRLFSLGTIDEYREKRRGRLPGLDGKGGLGNSPDSSLGLPPLPAVLLHKLRVLTTLTLASYTEELSLSGLAVSLSVSEEDVAASPYEFVDSLLLGVANRSTEGGQMVSTESLCNLRRTLLDTVVSSSLQATSAVTKFAREGMGRPVLTAEDAEDIVLAGMQVGWLQGKIDAENGVFLIESVAGRDVDMEDDLEAMKELLHDFGNRIEAAIALIRQNISIAQGDAEGERIRSEPFVHGC